VFECTECVITFIYSPCGLCTLYGLYTDELMYSNRIQCCFWWKKNLILCIWRSWRKRFLSPIAEVGAHALLKQDINDLTCSCKLSVFTLQWHDNSINWWGQQDHTMGKLKQVGIENSQISQIKVRTVALGLFLLL